MYGVYLWMLSDLDSIQASHQSHEFWAEVRDALREIYNSEKEWKKEEVDVVLEKLWRKHVARGGETTRFKPDKRWETEDRKILEREREWWEKKVEEFREMREGIRRCKEEGRSYQEMVIAQAREPSVKYSESARRRW